MKTSKTPEIFTDVLIIGFGSAGGCAAIEAHDSGAEVVVLEKQSYGYTDGHRFDHI